MHRHYVDEFVDDLADEYDRGYAGDSSARGVDEGEVDKLFDELVGEAHDGFLIRRRLSRTRPLSVWPPRAAVFANLGRAQTRLETVSGFSRYRPDAHSLPPAERARIDRVAHAVALSHRPGQRPIVTIRVVGHADFDTPRRPAFERKISGDRARSVQRALMAAIDRHAALRRGGALSRRIRWEYFGMGATRPLYPMPRTEAERARNRRVDILLEAVPSSEASRTYLTLSAPLQQPACTAPSPGQKVTRRVGGIVFDAEMVTTAFNPMPRGVIQQFVFAKQPGVKALRFSCHRVEARKDCPAFVIPAWALDGAVSATLPAGEIASDWEYGFIQTVQKSRILHVYGNTTGRECVVSVPTRDALAGTPAPWMQAAAVTTLGSAVPASLEDSPHTIATIAHPTQPTLALRQVCIEGIFLIWLAARKKNLRGGTGAVAVQADRGGPQLGVHFRSRPHGSAGVGRVRRAARVQKG